MALRQRHGLTGPTIMASLRRNGGTTMPIARIAKIAIAGAFAGLALPAAAQEWPSHPITLVVPFAAGGGVDASARLQALVMGEILGQTIVVENVGAAAGTVGSVRVAKAAPDGYTMLIGNSGTHAYSQGLYKRKPYDSVTDFEPVAMVTESPRLLVARKSLPVNNLQELIAFMKANQDKMQYSSAGVGSGTHLPCALLNHTLGVNITMVPYRGEGPALQDVIGDRIDYMCTTIQSGAVQARQGTVKGIAVMAPARAAIIPNVPTTGEQGLAGVEATVWNGFFFPKGTPAAIVAKTHKAIEATLARPDIREKMEALGLEILPPDKRTPGYLAQHLKQDVERWGAVIRAAGISMD
jgi:tripartite-type tricarboxylate transporter receptor subunit TctC